MGTACRKRSPPWLLPPRRSRSSLPPRESTPSGSAAPSWLPSPPSRRCGSPSRSTTSLAPASSTANASKKTRESSVISIHSFERFFSFYFLLTRSRIHHIILIRPSTNLIPSSQTPLLSLSSFYERQFFFAKKVSEILFFRIHYLNGA